MAKIDKEIIIKPELRLCKIRAGDGLKQTTFGYFHHWAVNGDEALMEFPDGHLEYVPYNLIKFFDDEHLELINYITATKSAIKEGWIDEEDEII